MVKDSRPLLLHETEQDSEHSLAFLLKHKQKTSVQDKAFTAYSWGLQLFKKP